MRLFLSHRRAAMRHWRHVGQPYLTVIGLAALVGLIAGVLWVVAGILNFHPLW